MTEYNYVDSTAIKKKKFLQAFELVGGSIKSACVKAGVSRSSYYRWVDSNDESFDKDFRQAVEDILQERGDFVESKLMLNIAKGDTTAIIFYAKTKLKDRGYITVEEECKRKMVDVTPPTPIVNINLHEEVTKRIQAFDDKY